jgi:hypothetical protein
MSPIKYILEDKGSEIYYTRNIKNGQNFAENKPKMAHFPYFEAEL